MKIKKSGFCTVRKQGNGKVDTILKFTFEKKQNKYFVSV